MGQVGSGAGLGGIPWNQVSHAYGPALEVPDWIAGLRDPGTAEQCLGELYGSITHQGSRWRDVRTIGGRIYELEEHGLPATLEQLTQWLTPDRS